MSLPDPHNPYSFEPFLERRDRFDYYADDPFLQRLVAQQAGDEASPIDARLREFSRRASFRWRDLAESGALPENRPRLEHYDGHGNRVDRILRPAETELLEREVFGSGLFSQATPRWERLAKLVLLHQNGEAGVTCALACTEGLIALVEAHRESAHPEVRRILHHCREGVDGDFGRGSQFLTEIQGGSDVPANRVEAVPDGDCFRLHGVKFFCSACHTDYAVVTAKVSGSEDVSTFLVPARIAGEGGGRRNGYEIRRLKRKLGTIELPTAEIEYRGAVGYAVGPLGRGVANVVGHVLTTSRIHVSISNAATSLRAAREARMYAEFREVFGRPVGSYPIGAAWLRQLERTAERAVAGLFAVYGELLALEGRLTAGLPRDDELTLRRRKLRLRIAIMLQKATTTKDTIDQVHGALSIFGGHGVMECFSALPRLLRDAYINEQWEGPRGLLLSQIHQDLRRVADWYPAEELVRDLLHGADDTTVRTLAQRVRALCATDFLDGPATDEAQRQALEWDRVAGELFHAFQDRALATLADQ